MSDCISVFCGARSSTDTLKPKKDPPGEKHKPNQPDLPENKHGTAEKEGEVPASNATTPGSDDLPKGENTTPGQLTAPGVLQKDWEEIWDKAQLLEKEEHEQWELKEMQEEKLRRLQMTLQQLQRRQSYQEKPTQSSQDVSTNQGGIDHQSMGHFQQRASLQNLYPRHDRPPAPCLLQRPDLLPQHKSLPQVHQQLVAPLPTGPTSLCQMRQQHMQHIQRFQQQIQQQQQQYMRMMQPHSLPCSPLLAAHRKLQPPQTLPPLPPLQPCHQLQMQQLQRMQQQLSQLHSVSHESLILKPPGFDSMKPSQSQIFTHSNEYKSVRQNQGQVVTESMTSYSIDQSSTTSEQLTLVENPVSPGPVYEFPHNPPPYHSCYSNVDVSNPFPVPVQDKPRPNSVYEGIFSDVQTSDERTECLAPMYSDQSLSDTDLPSMEESNSGSLSDQLHFTYSSSNLSTSDANELYLVDSGDENQSYYDSLPHDNEIIMTDEGYYNDNTTAGRLYIRSSSCPNVFNDPETLPPLESDFSGSTEFSEENTSEITETFSQSLESSDTTSLSTLSQAAAEEATENTECDVEPERQPIPQNPNNNKGQWSDLSKSAIAGLLDEMEEFSGDSADEENGNGKSDANGNFHHNDEDAMKSEVTNGDITLPVDVIPESDYDGDTDTLEKKREKVQNEKDIVVTAPSEKVNNDVTKEDDEVTLTGDSGSETESDIMTTVIRRDVKKGVGDNGGLETIHSPAVKRRGVCDLQIASSPTSLSNVSQAKMATVLQQQQPFKAKKSTWAMSCLRPCPPIRPATFPRDEATKSPRIGRKSSVNRRKPVEDVKTLEDDAHLLKVIEAYCTSAKTRQTVNSSLLDPPQMLIAEEEKIIVEERKGNQTVVEEKTLVDTVYSLKDQVKDLKTEHKRMRKDLEDERRARKRLEGLLRKSLRSLVETAWEEGATNS